MFEGKEKNSELKIIDFGLSKQLKCLGEKVEPVGVLNRVLNNGKEKQPKKVYENLK